MDDIDFGTAPNTNSGDDLPAALLKVQDGHKAASATAATAVAAAAANATAIAALQSGGLPFYNSGTPISTAGTLPIGVIDKWVFITGAGSYPPPAVPSSDGHTFIVTNIGSGDITVGAITLPTGRSVRLYSRNGSWQQFIDVSAGGAVVAKTLSVAFLQPSQNEGNSGTVTWTARFTRTGDTSAAISFTPTFDPGSTNGSDYQGGTVPSPGQQTVPANANYVDYVITTVGDTTAEPNEVATISLPSSLPTGYSAGTATSATMTIVNDDLTNVKRFALDSYASSFNTGPGYMYYNDIRIKNAAGTVLPITIISVNSNNASDPIQNLSDGDLTNRVQAGDPVSGGVWTIVFEITAGADHPTVLELAGNGNDPGRTPVDLGLRSLANNGDGAAGTGTYILPRTVISNGNPYTAGQYLPVAIPSY